MEIIERILGIIERLNNRVLNSASWIDELETKVKCQELRIKDLEQRLENMERWAGSHADDFLKIVTELDWRYYDLGQGPRPTKPRPKPWNVPKRYS